MKLHAIKIIDPKDIKELLDVYSCSFPETHQLVTGGRRFLLCCFWVSLTDLTYAIFGDA